MLQKITALTFRIKQILNSSTIAIVDTDSEMKLYSTLNEVKKDVSLILLDLTIASDLGIDLLIETRKRVKNTPIIVLTDARKRNLGWRIDYCFTSKRLAPKIKDSFILKDTPGSDHCPIGIKV